MTTATSENWVVFWIAKAAVKATDPESNRFVNETECYARASISLITVLGQNGMTYVRSVEDTRQGYYGDGQQPWDLMKECGIAKQFAMGCVVKYVSRTKGERQKDLEKCSWYLDRLIEMAA